MSKKVVLISASPRKGGNGDTLIEKASAAAQEAGAQVTKFCLRDKKINYCRACYSCRETAVCIQQDDYADILAAVHEADAVIIASPIYYNLISAPLVTAIDRLCCTFAYKQYVIKVKKKVAFMLTCTGSNSEEMKHEISLITGLPSIRRSVTEARTEVFPKCSSASSCSGNEEYLRKASDIGSWAAS